MKYKIGDKVRVRSDLEYHIYYEMEDAGAKNTFVSAMKDLSGKIVTISGYRHGQYVLEEQLGNYLWVDEMFDGYAFPEEDMDADADQLLGLLL